MVLYLTPIWDSGEHKNNNVTNCYCISDRLYLQMSNNPLICDKRIKWMKDGEEQGWLLSMSHLNYFLLLRYPNYYPPTCENFPGTSWDDVLIPESEG